MTPEPQPKPKPRRSPDGGRLLHVWADTRLQAALTAIMADRGLPTLQATARILLQEATAPKPRKKSSKHLA